MEIFVEGVASKYIKPNQVIANIHFKTSDKLYKEALANGINNVEKFNDLLKEIDLENKLQTRNFSIDEEKVYNEEKRKTEKKGYIFNQFAILKFDYDNKIIENLLNLTSKIDNAPNINFQFELKEKEKYLDDLINEAYNDANKKAMMMAKTANKNLKEAVSVDLNGVSNIQNRISESTFDSTVLKTMSINNMNINSICPEDIELNVKIYCKWIAE